MTRPPPPLRFLGLVVGLWVCGRIALLAPQAWVEPGRAAPAAPGVRPLELVVGPPNALSAVRAEAGGGAEAKAEQALLAQRDAAGALLFAQVPIASARARAESLPMSVRQEVPPSLRPATAPSVLARAPSRWSASAWALARGGEGEAALAPGGTLGGSQAGARLLYRLNGNPARPLSVSARLYSPLRDRRGAEMAVGLDWRPLAALPLNFLIERRQAIGSHGRSGFAAMLYGGHSANIPGGLRLDAYAQAGIVGLARRDAFADGSVRVGLPVGRVEIGASAWGAAQPGAARLDAGPHVAFRLPAAGGDWRLQADWRFRLAGDAAPGSGPAITLSADF